MSLGMMTPDHDQWNEFWEALVGEEGIDLRKTEDGAEWSCDHSHARRRCIQILMRMGLETREIMDSLDRFHLYGGDCDCNVAFYVADNWREGRPQIVRLREQNRG